MLQQNSQVSSLSPLTFSYLIFSYVLYISFFVPYFVYCMLIQMNLCLYNLSTSSLVRLIMHSLGISVFYIGTFLHCTCTIYCFVTGQLYHQVLYGSMTQFLFHTSVEYGVFKNNIHYTCTIASLNVEMAVADPGI